MQLPHNDRSPGCLRDYLVLLSLNPFAVRPATIFPMKPNTLTRDLIILMLALTVCALWVQVIRFSRANEVMYRAYVELLTERR